LLNDHNIKVIILDHHAADRVSPYKNTITINNQLSDYPNKDFCGGGIVWQFCRFLNDTLFHDDYYLKFLDLVSLANISDMMSMTSFETTYLIREGLKEENIKNPFISYMREKNAYSIGPVSTPVGWAFYITPFVNAIVRSGTMEEKELIFNSFLEYKAFQEVPSTKRGCKGQIEKLVE
jgi:single-stranded-DNA-specific exonuclease